MGDYTRINLRVILKPDTPESVLNMLVYSYKYEDDPTHWPDYANLPEREQRHPFLSKRHADSLLGDAVSCHDNEDSPNEKSLDRATFAYVCSTELKNYDNDIESFLDWLSPFVAGPISTNFGYGKVTYDWIMTEDFDEVSDHIVMVNSVLRIAVPSIGLSNIKSFYE